MYKLKIMIILLIISAFSVLISDNKSTAGEKLSQTELNIQLNKAFDTAFNQGNLGEFIRFANSQMPSINKQVNPVKAETGGASNLPDFVELQSGKTRFKLSKEFGIRIYYNDKEITTNQENIPLYYPWFQHDPEDPDNIADYAVKHVSRGSRGESPWPESQWPLVNGVKQGEQNWPVTSAAFGPYQLKTIKSGQYKAVFLSLIPDKDGKVKPNDYGVIPKGVFTVNPDSSIVMALQHENYSDKGLNWSPWFVLGFAMPKEGTIKNPSTIFAFPDSTANDPITDKMFKIWNYANIDGEKIAMINPHAKTLNETFKKFYENTNWSLIATKGSDYVILTRSILRHKEQYFPFLEHGKYFIEAEHTGPSVGPGGKSTVIVKHDFIAVSDLTGGKITKLNTENGKFEQNVRSILKILVQKDKTGELVSNYKR